jgi:tetratricopeptide (TPR) repeat protein
MNRLKFPLAALAALSVYCHCPAQSISSESILKNIAGLDQNKSMRDPEKLRLLYEWKKESDEAHLPQDSAYARLLHKLGVLEFSVSRNYGTAISLTLRALQINLSGKKTVSFSYAVSDYYNLAYYYDKMNLFKKALLYYDSTIGASGKTKHLSISGKGIMKKRLKKVIWALPLHWTKRIHCIMFISLFSGRRRCFYKTNYRRHLPMFR